MRTPDADVGSRVRLAIRRQAGICVVYVEGDVDAATLHEFQERMERLLQEGDTRIVLNARGLSFANTATFGFLYYLHETLQRRGGYFLLCELSPKINRIVNMLGLARRLAVYRTEEAALAAARSGEG